MNNPVIFPTLTLTRFLLKDKAMFILKAAISLALMVYLFYYFLSRPIERETLINIMATADLRRRLIYAIFC